MGDVERRAALRVPVQGIAICYGDPLPLRGTIENLSSSGALISISGTPTGDSLDLELKLGIHSGRVTARALRVERTPRRTRLALRFDDLDDRVRAAIDAAIDHAVIAAERRPVLVIDDNVQRRAALLYALETQGMSPVAARTPLDAIAILTNPHLAVSVALLAPSFGHSLEALRHLVSDSFPWVRDAEITNDVFSTLERAHDAWCATDSARLAHAIA
jgi:hypothetical protein